MIIISILLFMAAARFNAVMDVLTHHFEDSTFHIDGDEENKQWYDPSVSWKNKYLGYDPKNGRLKLFDFPTHRYLFKPKIFITRDILNKINYPVQITDAWHLNKTAMIICLALSAVTFPGSFSFWENVGLFIGYGVAWNTTFSLFYNKIFRKDGFVNQYKNRIVKQIKKYES